MLELVFNFSNFTILTPRQHARCPSYLRGEFTTPRTGTWRVEDREAAAARTNVTSGALSPAPGQGLTLSARIGVLMCPGTLRMEMECI